MYVWYDIVWWYISHDVWRIWYNLWHCCLGGESSVSLHCALLCRENICVVKTKMYRPVPSKKKKVPSLPIVKKVIYRPVPSWKIIYTVPSRRAKYYIPPRPVVIIFIYRPFPSWPFLFTVSSRHETKGRCTVASRPVEKIHTHPPSRPVPSRQL